ncbi:MAG: hypothetical protein R3C68_11315 [Myxococcota bacterium]
MLKLLHENPLIQPVPPADSFRRLIPAPTATVLDSCASEIHPYGLTAQRPSWMDYVADFDEVLTLQD